MCSSDGQVAEDADSAEVATYRKSWRSFRDTHALVRDDSMLFVFSVLSTFGTVSVTLGLLRLIWWLSPLASTAGRTGLYNGWMLSFRFRGSSEHLTLSPVNIPLLCATLFCPVLAVFCSDRRASPGRRAPHWKADSYVGLHLAGVDGPSRDLAMGLCSSDSAVPGFVGRSADPEAHVRRDHRNWRDRCGRDSQGP